ncbi:hypothetical protein M153_1960009177 [Pseudoloma neurophilia]|uniref:Vps16 C-terminal domain-containing protein n=1 Tax=Pseudoloma neurophilia TaxID=146866 RepID=A0A0R0M5C9_9MICR|nr:hypothetical protein M153_1960009177 [Pseudoloma neurophilia]
MEKFMDKIVDKHSFVAQPGDLFAITDYGGLVAQLKEETLLIMTMSGKVIRSVPFQRGRIQKIYFRAFDIIFMSQKWVKVYDIREDKFETIYFGEIWGCAERNGCILLITPFDIVRLHKKNFKYRASSKRFTFSQASNYFRNIESLIMNYDERDKNHRVKEMDLRSFLTDNKIKNILWNSLEGLNYSAIKRKFLLNHVKFMSKGRSCTSKYLDGKCYYKFRRNQYAQYMDVKFLKTKGRLHVFSTKEYIYISKLQDKEKLSHCAWHIEVKSNGVYIITSKDVFFSPSKRPKNTAVVNFCKKNDILYTGESPFVVAYVFKMANKNEHVLDLLKVFKMGIYDHFEIYYENMLKSDMLDPQIVEILDVLFKKYKFHHFFEMAIKARNTNRTELAKYLIAKEKNKSNIIKYLFRYRDLDLIHNFICKESDHLFVHSFLFQMQSQFSIDEIRKVTQKPKALRVYENFIRKLSHKNVNNSINAAKPFKINQRHDSADIERGTFNEFDSEMDEMLGKFQKLRIKISDDSNHESLATIDSAFKLLLEKKDKKNAFYLRYSSKMSNEKYEHLKDSILKDEHSED